MYALVSLLSLVVAASFVAGFVQGRRRWLPAFSVSAALLVLSHNWGLFLVAGTLASLFALWRRVPPGPERQALARDAALAYGGAGLLYLPWLPSLVSQALHTGAPWAGRPDPHDLLNGLTSLLGGPAPAMAFGLGAGVGLGSLLAAPRRAPRARAAHALAVMVAVALLIAWLWSQVSPAWAIRYFAVFLGPLLLLGAAGLARAGRLGLVVLAILAVFWFNPRVDALQHKSNAHTTAVLVRDRLENGDLVVAIHPEQGPLMHYYLPHDIRLRWANALGPVADPTVFDWRDALERLKAAKPHATEDAFVRSLKPGEKLLLVQPIIRGAHWHAPWTKLVRTRAAQWERVLDDDPRMARTLDAPHIKGKPIPRGVRAVLYERL